MKFATNGTQIKICIFVFLETYCFTTISHQAFNLGLKIFKFKY